MHGTCINQWVPLLITSDELATILFTTFFKSSSRFLQERTSKNWIEGIIDELALASDDKNVAKIRTSADIDRLVHTCILSEFDLLCAISSNAVGSNAVKNTI